MLLPLIKTRFSHEMQKSSKLKEFLKTIFEEIFVKKMLFLGLLNKHHLNFVIEEDVKRIPREGGERYQKRENFSLIFCLTNLT